VRLSKEGRGGVTYRPEIDGLRAIAVLFVVLYHADLNFGEYQWFSRGFIGVDVFFVISGYLIARNILGELKDTGSFNFTEFYEKRARRLLPALFTVMVTAFPFAWYVLLPSAFVEYSKSVLSALFFGSNFYFYSVATEYGATSSQLKPFLHTWSLAVEEQFYLAFPVLLLFAYRFVRSLIPFIIIVLVVVGVFMAESIGADNDQLNFYSSLTRFWELLAGALLAFFSLDSSERYFPFALKVLPAVGLYLIFSSFFVSGGFGTHPGLTTIFPVLGSVFIIMFSSPGEWVGRILSGRILVWVGLLSYSLYLWHFIIFSFLRIIDEFSTTQDKILGLVLAFVLSVISLYLIERPARDVVRCSRNGMLTVMSSTFLALIVIHSLVISSEGFPDRYSDITGFLNYERDNGYLRRVWADPQKEKNKHGFEVGSKKVLLVGNSHATDMFNALYLNKDHYYGYDFLRSSVGQIACFDPSNRDYRTSSDAFFNSKAYLSSDVVLISTRYRKDKCLKNKDYHRSHDVDGLPYLIERSQAEGKKIVVFGNTTEFPSDSRGTLVDHAVSEAEESGYLNRLMHNQKTYRRFVDKVNFQHFTDKDRRWSVNRKVRAVAELYGVVYIDKYEMLCDEVEKRCFGIIPGGYKSFYDYGHFTLEGAKFFGRRLVDQGFLDVLESLTSNQG